MIQFDKIYYSSKYDDLSRFISYFYQIDLVRSFKPNKILEIGIGNKTVSDYLKKHEFNIDTCDIDKKLKPDFIADIKKLPFKENSYDLVLSCEVLEHLPFSDFDKALSEIWRVTKKYAVISLPYPSVHCELTIKSFITERLFGKNIIDFFLRIPYLFKDLKFSGIHYWEIGRKSYPIARIRNVIERRFKIRKEIRPILNSFHHFFVLEKQ